MSFYTIIALLKIEKQLTLFLWNLKLYLRLGPLTRFKGAVSGLSTFDPFKGLSERKQVVSGLSTFDPFKGLSERKQVVSALSTFDPFKGLSERKHGHFKHNRLKENRSALLCNISFQNFEGVSKT